jgi:hypothetical protein
MDRHMDVLHAFRNGCNRVNHPFGPLAVGHGLGSKAIMKSRARRPFPNWEISMRMKLFVPLAAATALAACGGGADDEAISMEDAMEEMADSDFMPRPGQYRTSQELLEFELAGMPENQMEMVRQAFASGAAEESTYCITEEMTREKWISDMAESNCTITRFDTSGSEIDVAMSCEAEGGINGEMQMTGSSTGDSSDMVMNFSQTIPGMGEGKIRMRVQSERIGDCS